ncbi:Glu/Leu/Phe/Val family dehydrogenase [Mesorhizobium sp. CO1-1-8]|uniref:Glu/Leu/Phe/Val family dehydrogenase n=1 Tax=Mesorhizobium sp. CO1-1-8 TaxID=2876631 RepID=UPI001CD145F1|nr:Glu/Leu/Phe/Val dehydrogenase dimerization domain-containing protein [Mesorhizobium sp. CO1-1-8]MBZ9772219.1 amino acid dehydrogenase [Mesorhizobium sp. CO1-1-8]
MFQNPGFDGHERVVSVFHKQSGLRAFIAIHSTALGPAAGGCRLWSYDAPERALSDALRLSRGMSYKNAVAGLPMGGGKAVILGPVPESRRKAVFQAFGEAVESLGGTYITAEDVGVSEADMAVVAENTSYASGFEMLGGVGGDPSPFTAHGVRVGIESAAGHGLGRTDIENLHVAVQGLGGVGFNLCRELRALGARLTVADIAADRVEAACDLFGAERASVDDILLVDADVLAPCALGGAITEDIAAGMRARIVAGGANNQIANDDAGQILFERGITYAPDYVINAGGIIVVTAEYFGGSALEDVERAIDRIGDRTREVLERSRKEMRPSHLVADQIAREIIEKVQA